jgi:hypothetical protein
MRMLCDNLYILFHVVDMLCSYQNVLKQTRLIVRPPFFSINGKVMRCLIEPG